MVNPSKIKFDSGLDSSGIAFVEASPAEAQASDVSAEPASAVAGSADLPPVASFTMHLSHEAESTNPRHYGKHKHGLRGSYRLHVIGAFALIAALTAFITIGVVAVMFSLYFTSYTTENMEALAESTAMRIAENYKDAGTLEGLDYDALMQSAQMGDEIGAMVIDAVGNSVYTSAGTSAGTDAISEKQAPDAASQVAIASINVGNKSVGSVRIWVYGSDVLMNRLDREFMQSTYSVLAVAALCAIVVAAVLGILFSRTLVMPVSLISRAAHELSEGNLSARTRLSGKSEIQRLGRTFDEMAESLEREHDMEMRLTSDVAHELRTPLMAIRATVEAMMDGVYATDAEHLMLVDADVQRLSRLVDALLKLTRIEQGSQEMKESVVDLGDLAEEAVGLHEVLCEDKGLKIAAHVTGVVKSFCDRDMIKQCIANLISNAVRYTPAGGRIDVSVSREDDMAVIDVKDTGIGLSEEDVKNVFARFWRADDARHQESGGLGIGLTVVKGIIARHHGAIGVKGQLGVGSTFTIKIPYYDEKLERMQASAIMKEIDKRLRQ